MKADKDPVRTRAEKLGFTVVRGRRRWWYPNGETLYRSSSGVVCRLCRVQGLSDPEFVHVNPPGRDHVSP